MKHQKETPRRTVLPEQILDVILCHVAQQDTTGTTSPTLLLCTLVSRSFYHKAISHIYSDLSFDITCPPRFLQFQAFCSSLILNRNLGQHVTSLHLSTDEPSVLEYHIPTFNAFRTLTSLKKLAFVIGGGHVPGHCELSGVANKLRFSDGCGCDSASLGVDWASGLSLSVRTNLSILFSLPTLKHLTLSGLRSLPFSLINSLTKIQQLSLGPNLDIDTSDSGLLSQAATATSEEVLLHTLTLSEVSPNLIRALSSILSCKPGVVRQLSLAGDKWDLGSNLTLAGWDDEAGIDPLEEWSGEGKIGKNLKISLKALSKPHVPPPTSELARAAWSLIEVSATSLERFEWRSSPMRSLSFKPINLYFLRHTLRFLIISIPYHGGFARRSSTVLNDAIELCRQLSTSEAVLEEVTLKLLCSSPLNAPLNSASAPPSANSSASTLVETVSSDKSDKTSVEDRSGAPTPTMDAGYAKEWACFNNVLRSKKCFANLRTVQLEFVPELFQPLHVDWWRPCALDIEKRMAGTRSKGVRIISYCTL
ncbi:hypothetical protein FA15DRAFT_756388 [Coprinopsis marcescibilis]|uniref:F-box domain-containing protein n=1 Tax=Coprinopsis marcescibilis TaxID=230819 RepID=A0A5C3KVB5_COPMA|nr:hypothetical protein FA15DRAFT_756388 [Coprinopsis marcescibilis]